MSKEPFAQFLETLINKYIQYGTFVNNPENIVIGESMNGLVILSDESFPRLEILINKLKLDGYIDQRMMNQSFRFSAAGHIRRENDIVTPQDMYDAVKWGRELISILFTINGDKIMGNLPCDGFIQISGYPEVFMEYEMFPKITSVILVAEAEIQLMDTYTN